MTPFNPENKEQLTIGETYGPAMYIMDPDDAAQYLQAMIEHKKKFCPDNTHVRTLCLNNLGYYAGYYDKEVRARVEVLFNAQHPIFGSVQNDITPDECFKLGQDMANKS